MDTLLSLMPLSQAVGLPKLAVFDFDGVFTDNGVWVSSEGLEMVRCDRSDGLGINHLTQTGFPVYVVSKERNPVVARRCEKLKLPFFQAIDDKVPVLKEIAEKHGVPLSEIAYTGNDINDIPCLAIVGFPIVVADAYPAAMAAAKYITTRPGGRGAVREVCDWLLQR